jgi:hypothetical protein
MNNRTIDGVIEEYKQFITQYKKLKENFDEESIKNKELNLSFETITKHLPFDDVTNIKKLIENKNHDIADLYLMYNEQKKMLHDKQLALLAKLNTLYALYRDLIKVDDLKEVRNDPFIEQMNELLYPKPLNSDLRPIPKSVFPDQLTHFPGSNSNESTVSPYPSESNVNDSTVMSYIPKPDANESPLMSYIYSKAQIIPVQHVF